MRAIEIDSLDDPRVALYRNLKDRDLRSLCDAFVVEGRENLECLLERSPHRPESLLLSRRAHRTLSERLSRLSDDVPVYVASRSVLAGIVGFDMYRGVLALCRRAHEATFEEVFAPVPRTGGAVAPVVALEALTNHDNVGAIFRNAEAFDVPGILLCPRVCDPLYRKAIRTSLGATLCVPFVRAAHWPDPLLRLRALGYTLVALHPDTRAVPLSRSRREVGQRPLALLVGTEGPGLSTEALRLCDVRVRIEMVAGIDSINVATACAIALHHFRGAACA